MSVAAFIASQRTEHDVPHALACRALGVSQSWFYKWRDRPPTPRQDRRVRLADAVRKVFDDSGGTYGSPRIARWKVRQSMGRVGSCFDNAVAEATFSTIKVEYVHRRQFRTRTEARIKIATWITDFYNRRRRHSVCDGRSPIDNERSAVQALEAQAA
ncbi:Integrase core domain-containing protein [Micromonospora viridifaciens]|uniref:Integrase core domain-containing protein n=1 Tax=Micromonospora viridifaciens TaxID=1881 RepID=A0A1C4YWM1_MICVI|nr:integrase core domain-containing protein [Micromonospora viridifaciens]SCF25027.1 Integrase core domain-containing protein [Micromonospora viridifaciens]